MDKCRVNRITVNIDKNTDDVVVSLYKNNIQLAIINACDLEIVSFQDSGVSMKAYQAYCKDIVINLLDNDGISGYYYDPKEEHEGMKYDMSAFSKSCMDYVADTINENYDWKRTLDNKDEVLVMEQYNDKFIKNAKCLFNIVLEGFNVNLQILAEIKSGQMCRPRVMVYNGKEYTFNITNINRIVKSL